MGCLLYHFAYALNLSTPVYQVGAGTGQGARWPGKGAAPQTTGRALLHGPAVAYGERSTAYLGWAGRRNGDDGTARSLKSTAVRSHSCTLERPPQDNFVLAGNINMHMTRTPHDAQRPLAFLSGHELMKQCYYQNATKHWVICPNQFPCTYAGREGRAGGRVGGRWLQLCLASKQPSTPFALHSHAHPCPSVSPRLGGKPVLGLADCYLTLPAVNLAVLHFVRNPLDLFLSAFLYHTQDPPPEKWIETMKAGAGRAGGRDGGPLGGGRAGPREGPSGEPAWVMSRC